MDVDFVIINVVSTKSINDISKGIDKPDTLARYVKVDEDDFFSQLQIVEDFANSSGSLEMSERMWNNFISNSSMFNSALDLVKDSEEFSKNFMVTFEGCKISHPTDDIKKLPNQILTRLVSNEVPDMGELSVVFTKPVKAYDFYREK